MNQLEVPNKYNILIKKKKIKIVEKNETQN
jgi:hypothetical protein